MLQRFPLRLLFKMPLKPTIERNLDLLLIEVSKQVQRARLYLTSPTTSLLGSVQSSDDYVDNLTSYVQSGCFAQASKLSPSDHRAIAGLKASEVVAVNLERISDFCENVIRQRAYLDDAEFLRQWELTLLFDTLDVGLESLKPALESGRIPDALRVCRAEYELDQQYARIFQRVLQGLADGERAQAHVTVLFIAHYLERAGDSLLNCGEALLSAALGERIKLGQLSSLEDSLRDLETDLNDVAVQPLSETKSGARLARLNFRTEGKRSVIFKEGRTRKLLEERDSISRWQELVPGLAPKVYSFHSEGSRSAVLFEYLTGQTFEEILLTGSQEQLDFALARLMSTLRRTWSTTRRDEPVCARFVGQLYDRLGDVRAAHPEFFHNGGAIGSIVRRQYGELVEGCDALDASLRCEFSVFIHGDFNVDNVIFDEVTGAVRFIDLHRSRYMDYAQDASVFLVSNYRLQVFDHQVRSRIRNVIGRFFDFVLEFAKENGDTTLPLRLALGLARSFATSTRFVLDDELARSMFLRSRFILEHITQCATEDPAVFVLPKDVLFD